ncbi:hypothetical protein, partial [Acidithiobacillus thiooxidans]|uniref:hypothetical protein n=1 Tax=Acidithiobacillus thiooxidans TaxID=930 RepID=UPI001A7E0558
GVLAPKSRAEKVAAGIPGRISFWIIFMELCSASWLSTSGTGIIRPYGASRLVPIVSDYVYLPIDFRLARISLSRLQFYKSIHGSASGPIRVNPACQDGFVLAVLTGDGYPAFFSSECLF